MSSPGRCVSRITWSVAGILLGACLPGMAQQTASSSCLSSATETLSGTKQLPPPPQAFGGVIKEKADESKPCWPARVVPPKGAPNVLLIMTDDSGFGVTSTFGGVIPTPTLDRIAANGCATPTSTRQRCARRRARR